MILVQSVSKFVRDMDLTLLQTISLLSQSTAKFGSVTLTLSQ